MNHDLKKYAALVSCLVCSFSQAIVNKQSITFVKEELLNGITFKQLTEIENGTRRELFLINNKQAKVHEFEEALLQAEKEESKRERRRHQEERLKLYETQYRGHVKIAQKNLKRVIDQLSKAVDSLDDERLKPFMVFSPQTISSQEQLLALKEKLVPVAKKLAETAPDITDIKKVQDMRTEINELIPRVRDTFIETVNNGISKADDTKLLKELIALL